MINSKFRAWAVAEKTEDVIIGHIYQCSDYNKFSFIEENRDILTPKVVNLKKSINELGLLNAPILVNEKFEIIDGQHRFEACKDLDEPIQYIISSGYSIKHILALNNNVTTWDYNNFLQHFCKRGLREYIELKRFIEKHDLPSINVARGLCPYIKGKKFKSGGFFNANWEHTHRIARYYNRVKLLCPNWRGFYDQKYFVLAIVEALSIPDLDLDHFVDKISKNEHRLTKQGDRESYLLKFEEYYNSKKAPVNRIRFFEKKL